jgi:serine O-acetyltransferase
MAFRKGELGVDAVWVQLRSDVLEIVGTEPMLASYLHDTVLRHDSLESSIGHFLAEKLASAHLSAIAMRDVFDEALGASPAIREAIRRDLIAVVERDPAARGVAQPFLYFKGFHALQSYRVGHWLWEQGRRCLALFLQNRISECFDVDVHPAARLGMGILIDHGTGVVIGETAVVGDDVSMLHEVTLGGTGKQVGDRHPKVGRGVLIGAGAKILGNVQVGDGSKVAANSVVLSDVPPHTTVAGVPAVIVGRPSVQEPAFEMDQTYVLDFQI